MILDEGICSVYRRALFAIGRQTLLSPLCPTPSALVAPVGGDKLRQHSARRRPSNRSGLEDSNHLLRALLRRHLGAMINGRPRRRQVDSESSSSACRPGERER